MTNKQRLAAKEMVENGGNMASAMRKAGYSEAMVKNPKKVTQAKGFKEVLLVMGITDEALARVLSEGLNATKVLPYKSGLSNTTTVPDFNVRHRYLETCLKLKGYDKPSSNSADVIFINNLPRPIEAYKRSIAQDKAEFGI